MKNNYKIISIIIFVLTSISLLISYLLKTSGIFLIEFGLIGYFLTIIFFLLSKKNKRINKILLISFATLFLLSILFGTIDYYRSRSGKSPIFAILVTRYKDGGSKEYFGLGYKVIKCHNLIGDNSSNMGFYNLEINTTCINSSDIYPLYLKLIDNILSAKSYSKPEYIALDLDTFELLDQYYQDLLLKYTEKYNKTIVKANYQELKDNGYADEGGLNLKGYLISINYFKKANNNITLEIGRYKESLGAIGKCYKARYKNSGWIIKETCNWLS
ncbi:MAG: hypothetical protein PHG03_00435 [Bacilli bacterium]|nr:hypothetical protein [Bacilli bacterium]MDD4795012.1 hypothetical protein [Bacilli bacterium]